MDSTVQHTDAQPIVHCGNLSSKTTTVELISLFSPVAPITKISLKRKDDMRTAYAFVTFQSMSDAERIIEKFNFHSLHNKQITLSLYNPEKHYPEDANIFVKNLPPKLNSKDLYEIFKIFGPVVTCKVASDENGETKGFGYVQYKNAKSAKKAIISCQNAKIGSNVLEVMLYDKSIKDSRAKAEQAAPSFTNCYVKNFPSSMTEERLRSMLEKYGPVSSVYLPTDANSKPVGYACVNFANPEDALKAVEALHDKPVFESDEYSGDDIVSPLPFYIQRAEKKKDRMETLRKQIELLSLEGLQSKKNLYVSNIPVTFSKEEIRNIFSKFGTVTSIRIERTTSGSNVQYGYVCFSTPEEAAVALEKIGGTFLDENKLQISYYRNKMERMSEDEPVRTTQHPRSTQDSSHLVQSIISTVENSATLYKSDWSSVGVRNIAEFTQKMAREFDSLPEGELKEIAGSPSVLEDRIRKVINSKKSCNTSSN